MSQGFEKNPKSSCDLIKLLHEHIHARLTHIDACLDEKMHGSPRTSQNVTISFPPTVEVSHELMCHVYALL